MGLLLGAADPAEDLVGKALAADCQKIQIKWQILQQFGEKYLRDMIRSAHNNGIRVNYFFSDDPAHFLSLDVDTVLTNDYNRVSAIFK